MKNSHHSAPALLLALVCLLSVLSLPVHAAATAGTADLITLDEVTNLVVIIRYQTQEPDVAFLSPSGEQFAEELDNLRIDRGDQLLYCHLPQAESGLWRIIYDKKGPQELTIDFVREVSSLILTDLSAEGQGNDAARVTFQADFPEDTLFNYTIYAVVLSQDGQISGQRELTSGTGRTNQPVQARVSFRSLGSYDSYRLMAEVWLEDGGIEVSDTALFPEVFSYENTSAPNAMDNVSLRVELEDQGLVCDWSRWKVYGCDGYLLAVFQNGESEPYFFQEYESSITQAEVLIDPEAASLRVELTYRRSGTMSRTLSRTVDMSQAAWLEIVTPEQTNSAQAQVDHHLAAPLTARVTVNGQDSQLPLEGEGFFAVNLRDGLNRLSVAWSPEEELTFVVSREINCDRTPPILRLFETDGTVRTSSDRFLLAGQAELGCTLRVDGQEVGLEEDGTFLYELNLSSGDNRFEVELTDPSGNRTVQQLNIHRTAGGAVPGEDERSVWSFLPLILTAVGSLVLVTLGLLLFRKGKDGKRRVAFPMAVLFWVLTAAGAAVAGLCGFQTFILSRKVNSSTFLETAQNSFAQAYDLLQSYHLFTRLTTIAGITALALAVPAVLFTLISRRKPKQPKPPKGAAPPTPPQQ